MDDDDDSVMPYERPLDIALVFDGHDPDDLLLDDDEQEGQEAAQDGAGDGDHAGDSTDDPEPVGAAQSEKREPWVIVLAERDEAGNWRTVGEPLPEARFDEQGLAYEWAEKQNRRDFGAKFDWLANPSRAWLAVRPGQLGALKMNQPVPAPTLEERQDLPPAVALHDKDIDQGDEEPPEQPQRLGGR